jgi:site-specific recombinase XerD
MNIGKYIETFSRDMKLRNFSELTIKNYCSQVKVFLEHFSNVATKPSEISEEKIKNWLLTAKCINSQKHMICAIKSFYLLTGKQPMKFKNIYFPKSNSQLPEVLSQEEVQAMFSVCQNTKHKVILSLLYSSGLRVSELLDLKWTDINRSMSIIHIKSGKGNKDRIVPLAKGLIPLLEKYWKEYKTKIYVLAGQFGEKYSAKSVGEVLKQLAKKAGIKKRVWTHQMRHNAFTHMVENGVDINIIQKIAGHSNVKTTMIYTHLSGHLISKVFNPLDKIIMQ